MVNSQVVVLACVAGAGAVVLCGYAVTNFFYRRGPNEDTTMAGNEFDQVRYMREVRLRYA